MFKFIIEFKVSNHDNFLNFDLRIEKFLKNFFNFFLSMINFRQILNKQGVVGNSNIFFLIITQISAQSIPYKEK